MEEMDPSKLICSDYGWEVMAESGMEIYQVQKKQTTCKNCQLTCTHCNICLHKFQCSCLDSSIKYNMCKHIHLVARSIKETPLPTSIGRSGHLRNTITLLIIFNCYFSFSDIFRFSPFTNF